MAVTENGSPAYSTIFESVGQMRKKSRISTRGREVSRAFQMLLELFLFPFSSFMENNSHSQGLFAEGKYFMFTFKSIYNFHLIKSKL